MAADINDKFTEATNGTRPVPTTLTSLKAIGAASISCGALTGWPTATAVHFIIYTTDVNGRKVDGSQTDWKGVVSGTTITGLVLKAGTDNGYAVGAVVEAAPTAAWADDLTEGLRVEHNQDGTHGDVTATNIAIGDSVNAYPPVGAIIDFAGATSPTGWLLCYGQAISRATYADLFTVISTTYGVGDGSTTFNVPDLRGRVSAGQDDMGGSSANRLIDAGTTSLNGDTLGDTGGAETHTLVVAEIPSHNHAFSTYAVGASGGPQIAAASGSIVSGPTTNDSYVHTGGGGAHNNVQPTIILNKIIKI